MTEPVGAFNHVGHCVADLDRARRFYEELLGFTLWYSLDVGDQPSSKLLRVPAPMGMQAVYLVRDGLVLELLHFGAEGASRPRDHERVMNEPGLTHISLAVEDIAAITAEVTGHGGEVLAETDVGAAVFVRDPDGQLVELTTMEYRRHLPPLP